VTFGVRLGIVAAVSDELSEITLRLAGQVGASGLSLSAGFPGLLAAVDQHAAEVRDALALEEVRRGPAAHRLLGYARGFVEAAVGRGWIPRSGLDWESARLAAVCQLVTQAQARPQPSAMPLT
jgi:Family of unknown function (DUF6401)